MSEPLNETNGPGISTIDRVLREVWREMGGEPSYTPTLDEVLIAIRGLQKDTDPEPVHPEFPDDDDEDVPDPDEGEPVRLMPVPSATFGITGTTLIGYSAAEVMTIREHEAKLQAEERDQQARIRKEARQ